MEHVPHALMVVFLIHRNGDVYYHYKNSQLDNVMTENSIFQLCNNALHAEITREPKIIISIAPQTNVTNNKF